MEPLKYNPYQQAFWEARRLRTCPKCATKFKVTEHLACPNCGAAGIRDFHRLTLISGRRGGKTRAASIAAVEEAMVPNTIGWCCAPTVPKLHRYVLPALQQLIPPNWVKSWNSEFGDIRLTNGSLIHLQTLENPDQGRGQGLDWVWIDEAAELGNEHWHVLRPSLTERRGAAIFSTSPRSYDWVWEELYSPAERGVPGYWACRYSTSENPIISIAELADAKASMPDLMYRQEYEADFVTFTGAIYGDELKESHFISTDDEVRKFIPEWPSISPHRQILVGIDTGADHPFGAVKLVLTEEALVVVDEYLERNRSFLEHATSLRLIANSPTTRWAINKNDKQPAIELAQHGVYCQKSENDLMAGTERVKSWLHQDRLFFVRDRVPNTIKQMRAYRWDDNKAADGQARKERAFKKNDELPDALRYALMSWPHLPKPRKAELPKRDISKLSPDHQRIIERIREIDNPPKDFNESTTSPDLWN